VTGGICGTFLRAVAEQANIENVSVEVEIDYAQEAGLVARLEDNSNYYLLQISDDSGYNPTKNLIITKRVGGAFTELGSADVVFGRDTSHRARLEVNGSSLKAYFDDVEVISLTDSAISAAGRMGLWNNVGGAVANFYDLHVHDLSGTPGSPWGKNWFYQACGRDRHETWHAAGGPHPERVLSNWWDFGRWTGPFCSQAETDGEMAMVADSPFWQPRPFGLHVNVGWDGSSLGEEFGEYSVYRRLKGEGWWRHLADAKDVGVLHYDDWGAPVGVALEYMVCQGARVGVHVVGGVPSEVVETSVGG